MIKKFIVGVGVVLAPVFAFAEGSGGSSFAINESFADMDMSPLITALGQTLFTNITAAIGLAAGCWGIVMLWQKIKKPIGRG